MCPEKNEVRICERNGSRDTGIEKGQEVLELRFPCSPRRITGMKRRICSPYRRTKLEHRDALEKMANPGETHAGADCA